MLRFGRGQFNETHKILSTELQRQSINWQDLRIIAFDCPPWLDGGNGGLSLEQAIQESLSETMLDIRKTLLSVGKADNEGKDSNEYEQRYKRLTNNVPHDHPTLVSNFFRTAALSLIHLSSFPIMCSASIKKCCNTIWKKR